MHPSSTPDPNILKDLVIKKMPYGKYKGRIIADIPIHYLEWMQKEGFPEGKLGMWLSTCYEIKINGLQDLLHKLKQQWG